MSVKPTFNTGMSPNGPAQLALVADFAEQGWAYRHGTAAERAALTTAEKAALPVWADDDNGLGIYKYNGTAWLPIGRATAKKMWEFPRVSANPTDTFASGSLASLAGGTITGAPAGDYRIGYNASLLGSVASLGNMRLFADAANVSSDIQAAVGTLPTAMANNWGFTWAGGDLALTLGYLLNSGTGAVNKNGTSVWAYYVSP